MRPRTNKHMYTLRLQAPYQGLQLFGYSLSIFPVQSSNRRGCGVAARRRVYWCGAIYSQHGARQEKPLAEQVEQTHTQEQPHGRMYKNIHTHTDRNAYLGKHSEACKRMDQDTQTETGTHQDAYAQTHRYTDAHTHKTQGGLHTCPHTRTDIYCKSMQVETQENM